MERKDVEYRKMADLRKGDLIFMRIPFEENTTDYYNGYDPKEIRGHKYRDRFGDASKPRFVVVVGREADNIIYLPLSSRCSKYSSKYQYVLQDNSMTVKKDPNMKSYVEISSLRAVHADLEQDIEYNGRLAENDMINIMIQLGKQGIDFESKRDQRAYVSQKKVDSFERRLAENGYKLINDTFEEKTYREESGRTVTKSKWGLVKYHVPLSKEEVAAMIAVREGKAADGFEKAVADITEKSGMKESEVIK